MTGNEMRDSISNSQMPSKAYGTYQRIKNTSFSNEGIVNVRIKERKGPKMTPRF